MSITVTENVESRETGKRSSEWQYTILGTADQVAAAQALTNEALGQFADWIIDDCSVEPVFVDEENPDECHWRGTVRFVPPEFKADEPMETGQSSYAFDTGGGSRHITHIRNPAHHVATYGAGAPDPKGGIGVTADSIEGVDLQVPVFTFSETHIVPDATVTEEYKGILYALTNTTNAAVFRGCAVGECLFDGAAGSQRGDEDWEILFRFAASPNMDDIQIGDITGIAKKGWEYLWVRSESRVDAAAKVMIMTPIGVYVEQLYEAGDFEDIGIG